MDNINISNNDWNTLLCEQYSPLKYIIPMYLTIQESIKFYSIKKHLFIHLRDMLCKRRKSKLDTRKYKSIRNDLIEFLIFKKNAKQILSSMREIQFKIRLEKIMFDIRIQLDRTMQIAGILNFISFSMYNKDNTVLNIHKDADIVSNICSQFKNSIDSNFFSNVIQCYFKSFQYNKINTEKTTDIKQINSYTELDTNRTILFLFLVVSYYQNESEIIQEDNYAFWKKTKNDRVLWGKDFLIDLLK